VIAPPADLGLGLGLRGPHLAQWLREPPPAVQWIEAITDNYLANRGWLRRVLVRLAESRPVVLHGVGLNIGSTDRLDRIYLRQVRQLAAEVRAPWVSDHLCWTGVGRLQTHDLLPMPYTDAALHWLVERIRAVQELLERPLVLENPSTYLAFRQSTWTEWDFLAELCERADCGLLIDVNNVHVSAFNHGFDEARWLAAVPWARVWQLHVAGHTTYATHKLDTHVGPVPEAVWRLYGEAWARCGGRSTLLEWDQDIPDLDVAVAELCKARAWQAAERSSGSVQARRAGSAVGGDTNAPAGLRALQRAVLRQIATGRTSTAVQRQVLPTSQLTGRARVAIHGRMYALRLDGALAEDFARTAQLLGRRAFAAACAGYRRRHPSRHWALEQYGIRFAAWLASQPRFAGNPAQLARLEWAVVQTRLAPGCDPLAIDWADRVGGTPLAQCCLRFAPGVRVQHVAPEVWHIWSGQALRSGKRVAVRLSPAGRHVAVRSLSPAEAAALSALRAGMPILQACAAVARRSAAWGAEVQVRLGDWLRDWVADGAVVAVEPA